MLSIKLLCVGKIKDKNLLALSDEYSKRLSKYCKLEIIEVNDEKIPDTLNNTIINNIKISECKKIKDKINKLDKYEIFALDLKGKNYSSEEFSIKISDIATYHSSNIIFIIGGSLGLSDELLNLCNERICFSKMTFPHQLIRIFLLEQIFRCFKILNNESYHK